jgi:hypothetical protein
MNILRFSPCDFEWIGWRFPRKTSRWGASLYVPEREVYGVNLIDTIADFDIAVFPVALV